MNGTDVGGWLEWMETVRAVRAGLLLPQDLSWYIDLAGVSAPDIYTLTASLYLFIRPLETTRDGKLLRNKLGFSVF